MMVRKKAKKKPPITPKSTIKAALRMLWLRSRERAEAIKRDDATCQVCGKKRSVAKGREVNIEVHHVHGIDWDDVCEMVSRRVLQTTKGLITLCKQCHKDLHKNERENSNG